MQSVGFCLKPYRFCPSEYIDLKVLRMNRDYAPQLEKECVAIYLISLNASYRTCRSIEWNCCEHYNTQIFSFYVTWPPPPPFPLPRSPSLSTQGRCWLERNHSWWLVPRKEVKLYSFQLFRCVPFTHFNASFYQPIGPIQSCILI